MKDLKKYYEKVNKCKVCGRMYGYDVKEGRSKNKCPVHSRWKQSKTLLRILARNENA